MCRDRGNRGEAQARERGQESNWDGGHAQGGRMEAEDRKHRNAWHRGEPQLSAYTHRLALPAAVAPGDTGTARAVVVRIDKCLEMVGQWTHNERRRLKGMREIWERRAEGRDVVFQLEGWVRGSKVKGTRTAGMARVLEALRV